MSPKIKLPACGFFVTVKENDRSVPIKIKKVAKGKRVSILSGITGSRAKAVETLKQMLGVGGEVSTDVADGIELQGDQTARLPIILRNLGALNGAEEPPSTSTVRANYAYDKFMKRDIKSKPEPEILLPEKMSEACVLVHGRYWPFCNGDCSFCPPLTDVFEGLDMYCSWWEDPGGRTKPQSDPNETMTESEIKQGLRSLGMTAEVGEACKQYEKEKHMRVLRTKTGTVPIPPAVVPQLKTRADPPKSKQPFINRPVRVILNNPVANEDDDWFVMEVSIKDRSLWMSDYEEFVVSLLADADISAASHELIDSRLLKLLFPDRPCMLSCSEVLGTVMPDFFEIRTKDRINRIDVESDLNAPNMVEADDGVWSDDMYRFQEMAESLGLESSEKFWELFTSFCEECDGSNEGLLTAFGRAVLEVTEDE